MMKCFAELRLFLESGSAIGRRYFSIVDKEGVNETGSSMATAHGDQANGNASELEHCLSSVFDELRLKEIRRDRNIRVKNV